jgi:hypothetical protein
MINPQNISFFYGVLLDEIGKFRGSSIKCFGFDDNW